MKKMMSWTFVGLFFVSITSSCGSSKERCDAYGDVDVKAEQNNLAQE